MKNLRLLISSIIAIAIIGGSFMIYKKISLRKKAINPQLEKIKTGVFTEIVKNEMKPLTILASGNLKARDRIELFAEVQGIFDKSRRIFKEGTHYKKGELLVQINSSEYRATLQVQKSNLYQKMIAILPDLKLDYPDVFPKWDAYVKQFDVNTYTQMLPEFQNDQEKLFISGKGIVSAYFIVKNAQERLRKYNLIAPFSGVLITANVTKGTLIRPNQHLGSFISTNIYELEVAVNSSALEFMKVGKSVKLNAIDGNATWTGKLARINGLMDQRTQSSTVYIQVSGKGLKEGMYLQSEISANQTKQVFIFDRSLLQENNTVYIVTQDSLLTSVDVTPVHFNEKDVFVEGLRDGTIFVNRSVPGAFNGKLVKIIKD